MISQAPSLENAVFLSRTVHLMRRPAPKALRTPLIASFLLVILLAISLRSPSASAANELPNAEGGKDKTAAVAEEVHFYGNGTDADGFIARYEWDFDGDSKFEYSSPTTGEASWTYQAIGIYYAVLKVTDNDGGQDNDTVKVTIVEGNEPPTADAGPDREVHAMDLVTFNGKGKDPDGHIMKYEWDFDGDRKYDWSSTKNGTATWVYPATGTFYPVFRVTDDGAIPANATAAIKVVVYPANKPPVAKAGEDLTVHAAQTFRVNGGGYDVDGKITHYSWDFTSDGIADRESSTTGEALWNFDLPGTYTATLTVTDNAQLPSTGTDSIRITVLAPNKPPMATALPATTVYVGQLLFFNGTGADEDGHIIEYRWDFCGNGTYTWTSSKNGSTFWAYGRPGTMHAVFTVVDDVGAQANATRVVTVLPKKAPPAPPLVQFNVSFVLALMIGICVGAAIAVVAVYSYLHVSIANKYKKIKELEVSHAADEEASFRGTQVGEREPPSFRGGEGGL